MTQPIQNRQPKGSDWLHAKGIVTTPFTAKVADILGVVFLGIYHLPEKKLLAVDWSTNADIVRLHISKDLATYDSGHLTWLVVLCHDQCIRLEIQPRSYNYLTLVFTSRVREGLSFHSMPTMEDHLKIIRDSQLYKNTFSGENNGNE